LIDVKVESPFTAVMTKVAQSIVSNFKFCMWLCIYSETSLNQTDPLYSNTLYTEHRPLCLVLRVSG